MANDLTRKPIKRAELYTPQETDDILRLYRFYDANRESTAGEHPIKLHYLRKDIESEFNEDKEELDVSLDLHLNIIAQN